MSAATVFSEDELRPLSALQHLLYCERRAALVHTEGLWAESTATIEGAHLHQNVDRPGQGSPLRDDVRVARGVPLRSLVLGLSGKSDVIEFHPLTESAVGPRGASMPGFSGVWTPFPVEYKRGRLRKEEGYEVQLCAQALCLEEMLNADVPAGAIFFGETRRRLDVNFDVPLREQTKAACQRLHELLESARTPPAVYEAKCDRCSLLSLCMPRAVQKRKSVETYLNRMFSEQP